MKTILSIFLVLIAFSSFFSQSFLKEYSFSGVDNYQTDNALAVCELPSKNLVIVADNVRGNTYFSAYGYATIFKVKPDGSIIDKKELSISYSGNITTLNFINGNQLLITSGISGDGALSLIDTNLNLISHHEYYGGLQYYYNRLTQTIKSSDGNYVSVGTSGGLSAAQASLWVLKTDVLGNVLWGNGYGLGGDEDGADIIEINGAYYAYGYGTGFYGYTVPWLIKVDKNGILKWAKIIKAPYGGGNCRTILKKGENELLLTYEASYNSASNNLAKSDICITVIDTNGNNVWSKKYLSPTFNKIGETKLDENGNIYFSGFLDQDTSYRFVGDIYESLPYITKLDGSGNVIWSKGMLDTTKYISGLTKSPLSNNFIIDNNEIYFIFSASNKDSLTDGGSRYRYKVMLSKTLNGNGCVYNNPTTSIVFTPSIIDVTDSVDVLSGNTKTSPMVTYGQVNYGYNEICNEQVGIENNQNNLEVKIYPNPINFGEKLKITGVNIDFIQIYDANGNLIEKKTANNVNSFEFHVNFTNGVYFVGISSKNNMIYRKLVVNK